MLKLYGQDGRSFRCAWMLEEAGVGYERIPVKYATDTNTPHYLAVNPNGKIPALNDNGLILFESLAINIHIAREYADDLWPTDGRGQSQTLQWTAWALSELEGPHDAANRSKTAIDAARLDKSLNALRQALLHSTYLIGNHFSVADLNTAAVLLRPGYVKIAKADPAIGPWFNRCINRESLRRATSAKKPNRE